MKSILLAFVLCFASLFSTLEAQTQVVKDSLSISKVIGIDQKTDYKGYEVKFKKVITDSRCPKNVMCVRAGEADVLVSIFKNGRFLADKKIRIDASGYVMESTSLVSTETDFKIYGFSLSPYPDGVNDIEDKAYRLEIVFQPKGSE